ncbi:GpE family phage tail protein [Sphingomonas gilva]|uniref:GpE family phage tail protein n=1 Tax=Sphingomonas gilva TaxID=2305907 RepID=A0A396RNI2_9SPHN|nr:GpE family phage tail protein [Sphingomonas gilva]
MAAAFHFGAAELLDMDLDDLRFWHGRAMALAKETDQ